MKGPLLIAGVVLALSSVGAGSVRSKRWTMPDRHRLPDVLGRDFWRVLYKYGDWACWADWASPARLVRFDNPEIYDCPAFNDVAWVYFGRRPAPEASTGLLTWRTLAEQFHEKDPDRVILTEDPDPKRPFFLNMVGKRGLRSWVGGHDIDQQEYDSFVSRHPNLVVDGSCSEWLNDLFLAYRKIPQLEDPRLKASLIELVGLEPPRTRYEICRMLRRYYNSRRRVFYNGRLRVADGHLHSFHLAKDFGATLHSLETTDTCGYGTTPSDKIYARGHYDCDGTPEDVDDNAAYRWNVSAMFGRGAARQFKSPWEWYIAGYANGWTEDGKWWNNTVTVYPESDSAPKSYQRGYWHCGPDFGQSVSNLRRALYLAYLSGCTFENVEEWTAQFTMWDTRQKKTVISPRGKMYIDFAEFARKHPDRGAAFAPVGICVPVAQGYPSWGGYPWGLKRCGYTQGDSAVDAVFYTLVPGYERAQEHRKGVEYNIPHSPFAQMYDVVAPDVTSQSESELLDVFRSYKTLVMAGDYPKMSFANALRRYQAEGGRVIWLDERYVVRQPESKINEIMAGRVKFPAVEALFERLQSEHFPLKVKGDVCYGLNRTKDGWWLWAINSKGVIKFVDKPQRIDHSHDSLLQVQTPEGFGTAVRELVEGKEVSLTNGAFADVIPAGDVRVYEIR